MRSDVFGEHVVRESGFGQPPPAFAVGCFRYKMRRKCRHFDAVIERHFDLEQLPRQQFLRSVGLRQQVVFAVFAHIRHFSPRQNRDIDRRSPSDIAKNRARIHRCRKTGLDILKTRFLLDFLQQNDVGIDFP